MPTVQVSAQLDMEIEKTLDDYCQRHRIVASDLIQVALVDRLQELQDTRELRQIRDEPTRPFSDVVADLDLDGTV